MFNTGCAGYSTANNVYLAREQGTPSKRTAHRERSSITLKRVEKQQE
jgi:hypothetical protein